MTDPIEDMRLTMSSEHRRRASGGVLVGVAALALVGALAACQPPGENPSGGGSTDATTEPEPTATDDPSTEPEPTETDGGTDDDTDGGTDDDTDGGSDGDTDGGSDGGTDGGPDGGAGGGGTDAGLPDFSDAIFPECGEAFAGLPERQSDLVVEGGPSAALPEYGGGWMSTVTNNGSELVQGQIAMLQLVVVDGDGTVVGTPDPDDPIFLGAEGPYWMGVAPGESLEVGIPMTHSCDTGDWLPAGSYQAYATITFVNSEGDFGDMEQAQGGPWDITVGGGDSSTTPIVPPGAALANLECGQTWGDPTIDTGYELELIHQIRSPRSATDDIDGSAIVTTGGPINGLLFTQVLVLKDGVIMNMVPGSDTAMVAAATAGANVPLGFEDSLYACDTANDPRALPAGSYQAVVVVVTANEEGTHVLAATDPVALELT